MAKLLDQAISTIKALPEADQDLVAEFLLGFADTQRSRHHLAPEQIRKVEAARQEAAAERFASDGAMDSVSRRFSQCSRSSTELKKGRES